MAIDRAFLDELRSRVRISDLIQRSSVTLKRNGREWKACCPFHDEKTPSFTVNDQKGFYHCFGCGAHGDVVRWLTDHENMGFIDAVKQLAEDAGLEMPAYDNRAAENDRKRQKLMELNAEVANLYHDRLLAAEHVREYLKARGISSETAHHFEMGYADEQRGTSLILKRWGSLQSEMEALGLIRKRDDGSTFDFFRDRLMIPIHDTRGKVVGFGGRILGKGEPKYLNSPDTPVFDKGKTLFNIHRAVSPARKAGRLLIVEGYMDVIGLHGVGISEVVAPNGTALTEAQIRLAWRYEDRPIVLLDGDRAGKAAAVKAAIRALPLMEPGKSLQFAFPPDGKDPDDLARESGAEGVNEVLSQAQGMVQVLWQDLNNRYNTSDPDGRAALRKEARQMVGSIKNVDVKRAYGEEFASLVDENRYSSRKTSPSGQNSARSPALAVEDMLMLTLLANSQYLFDDYETVFKLRWSSEEARSLIDGIADLILDRVETPETLLDALDRQGFAPQIRQIKARCALKVPELNYSSLRLMVLDTIRTQRKIR